MIFCHSHWVKKMSQAAESERGVDAADGDGVHVRAQAFILTYQRRVYEDKWKGLTMFGTVKKYSWAVEIGTHDHTHFFVVLREKPISPVDLRNFAFDDEGQPHCAPSTSRGRSARRSWDRAYFYCFCPFKTNHVDSGGNYRPCRDYAGETSWLTTLWRQGKVDDVIAAAAQYRCLTPNRRTWLVGLSASTASRSVGQFSTDATC